MYQFEKELDKQLSKGPCGIAVVVQHQGLVEDKRTR